MATRTPSQSADRRENTPVGIAAVEPARREAGPRDNQSPAEDATDYEHRHFVNLAAAAVLLFIAIAIIWTVQALEDYEKLQRCLSSGKRDCIDLNIPARPVIYQPNR